MTKEAHLVSQPVPAAISHPQCKEDSWRSCLGGHCEPSFPAFLKPACLHTKVQKVPFIDLLIHCTLWSLAGNGIFHVFLTNSVGWMKIVQSLLADRLAALLVLCWKWSADQRTRLGWDGGKRRSLYGLDSGGRVDAAHCQAWQARKTLLSITNIYLLSCTC